jgi:hypothetical protein
MIFLRHKNALAYYNAGVVAGNIRSRRIGSRVTRFDYLLPILGAKIGVFLENQCYDDRFLIQFFSKNI